MKKQFTIMVLGYSGTMGQRMVRLLKQYLPGHKIIGASRSAPNVDQLETRSVNFQDVVGLKSALHDVDILIHTAGPFQHDPTILVNHCIQHEIHYIDIAESLSFIKKIREISGQTKSNQTAIISGCSTVPGLVACLAQKFKGLDKLSHIEVLLNLGSKNPVTLGLCFSLLRPLGKPANDGNKYFRQFKTQKHLDNQFRHYANYPIPFDNGIEINKQPVPISFFTGFDRKYINYMLYLSSYFTNQLSDSALKKICALMIPLAGIAKLFGGEAGHLTLIAKNNTNNTLAQIEIKANKNGLDIPAVTAVWAAEALIYADNSSGFRGLEDLLGFDQAVDKLRMMGYEVSIS